MYWVGVDVGGTFTDVIVYDVSEGRLRAAKSLSTPDAPERAVLEGLRKLDTDLGDATRFVHGTTRVTNALLEGSGKPVALITTRGFRDLVAMGRGYRRQLYSVKELAPVSPVPRQLCFEVTERLQADGSVLQPLDEKALDDVLDQIDALDVSGVAVCFLHSYLNPVHEHQVLKRLEARWPERMSSASADVVAEIGEYERFATTALNVKVKPFVDAYLGGFEDVLAKHGYRHDLSIMNSSGGVVSATDARRVPMQLALSGPAGGVAASCYVAGLAGYSHVITCDMGGTSTDVCLIRDGQPTMTNQGEIGGYPNKTFQIEIRTIGAGGGSVAWVDIGGELSIGPRSAGSDPGPACYGRGSTEPTTTDAHLIVGHLDPDEKLGGEVQPDLDAARSAMASLGDQLGGIGVERLALGVIQVAVAKMTSAIKEITYARGMDPRDFVLLPFGGAGPMHATALADELGIDTVLVPPVPGNLSALGFITARARHDLLRTRLMPVDDDALERLRESFDALRDEGLRRLKAGGLADAKAATLEYSIGMRIRGQSFDLAVPVTDVPESVAALVARFREMYEARYAYLPSTSQLEIVNCRLTAFGPQAAVDVARRDSVSGSARTERRIYTVDGWTMAGVYQRGLLAPGDTLDGPAIVVESGATTVMGAGWTATVDDHANLILARDGR